MKTSIIIDRLRMNKGLPAIVTLTDSGLCYANEIIIRDDRGVEVVRVTGVAAGRESIGGARIWLETDRPVDNIN